MKNAVNSNDDVWYIEPSEFKGNDLVRLYYNGSSGRLEHAKEIWIHGGHNNWKDGLSIVERLVKYALKGGGAWWYADVVVPDQALVLDWVFADGPPQNAVVYDTTICKISMPLSQWLHLTHNIGLRKRNLYTKNFRSRGG